METNFTDKYGMRPYDEYTIKWLEKSARQGVLKKNLLKNAYNAVYKSANDILKARIKTLKALGHEELVKKYKEWIDDEEELTYVSNRISYVYDHVESKWHKILVKAKTRKLKW